MPRVVPSQVVNLIEGLFYEGRAPTDRDAQQTVLDFQTHGPKLRAVLDLVEEIPTELLVLDQPQYTQYALSRSWMRHSLEQWMTGAATPNLRVRKEGEVHPLVMLYRALAQCPDEAPAPGTSGLEFIPNQDMREGLRLDLSAATADFTNGEWKGATVLAGSVVEALLLWALDQRTEAEIATVIQARGGKLKPRNPDSKATVKEQLPYQDLHWFTEVAAALDIITEETRKQISLAKNFRNLIHPGRVKREERQCTRGTALSTLAAVHHVIEELEAKHTAGKKI
jgi:hypothetical protein